MQDYDSWTDASTWLVEEDLSRIKSFLTSFGGHLRRQEREFARRVAEYNEDTTTDDEFGYYAEQLSEEATELDLFGRILRNQVLASLCTYFELQAVKLTRSDFIHREGSTYTNSDERKAAMLANVRRYDNLPDYWKKHGLAYNQGTQWDEITKVRKVRHKIMHTNGELSDDDESQFIRRHVAQRHRAGQESLSINENLIVAETAYCEEVAEVFRTFLLQLIDGIATIRRPNEK